MPPILAKPMLVTWHFKQDDFKDDVDRQPIYSADFQPKHGKRLATSGGDCFVRVWSIRNNLNHNQENDSNENSSHEKPELVYLSTLAGHYFSVNCVRFDPSGKYLASADDGGVLIIWEKLDQLVKGGMGEEAKQFDEESWGIKWKQKVDGTEEIFDLAWSPDSKFIILGSMKNVAKIYDVTNKTLVRTLAEHSGIVQGVAWDPLNEYIATQSSDRAVHIYKLTDKEGRSALAMQNPLAPHRIDKAELPLKLNNTNSNSSNNNNNSNTTSESMEPPASVSRTHSRKSSFSNSHRSESPSIIPEPAVRQLGSPSLTQRGQMLYGNESATTFFRRLTFSPDGSLLFTPTGLFRPESKTDKDVYTVYIYTRKGLNRPPAAHLPGLKTQALAVRCSPVRYQLRSSVETIHQTIDSTTNSSITQLPPPSSSAAATSANATESRQERPTAPVFKLPYRIVYAVATKDTVLVYDTQQSAPLCIISNLSVLEFTDLAWNPDGNSLIVTSTDGFCSIISFQDGALGEPSDETNCAEQASDLLVHSTDRSPSLATDSGHDHEQSSEPKSMTPVVSHVQPAGLHGSTPVVSPEKRTLSTGEDDNGSKKKQRRIAPQLISKGPK